MKKIINRPADFVDETMEGIVAACGDHIRFLNGDRRVLISGYPVKKGKVGIVTAGGSGHLPLFLGYVGAGMADACAVGNVFASPAYTKMAAAIRAADSGAGVLCLYGNYGGDRMNFEQAIEDCAFDGIRCRSVRACDDAASAPKENAGKRRGVAGIFYAYKCAGAAADQMRDLDAVAAVAEKAAANTRTMGVALTPCIVPEANHNQTDAGEQTQEHTAARSGDEEECNQQGKLEPEINTHGEFLLSKLFRDLFTYFEGDNTPVEDYVSHETYSIRDDNYTLSVISSVADTSSAYLLVTIDAKNDAAAAALMADDFENMDTFSVRALENEAVKPEPTPTGNGPAVEMPVAGGFSYGEKEALRTETSRTYSMRVDELNAAVYAVQLRLGLMEEGAYVEIPVEPVEPVTVEVNAEGTGSGTFDHIEGGAPVTLETVSLSPLSIQMEYSFADADGDAFPLLFFRMTDGSLCGWGQIVGDNLLGPTSWNDRGTIHCDYAHPLRSVLELSQVDAVVFNGMAYPLDGGRPEPVEIDPALYPFQIPLMDRLSEGGGYSVPVRALCEGLGVDCVWSNEAQTAAMTYRGVTITLTPGSTTALVDGQPVEMLEAPAAQDGKLAACYAVFEDAWQVSMSAAYDNWPSDNAQRVAWLVIP